MEAAVRSVVPVGAARLRSALLRQQSLITPECGLGLHNISVAERVLRINAELSRRVRDQAAATRFSFGA